MGYGKAGKTWRARILQLSEKLSYSIEGWGANEVRCLVTSFIAIYYLPGHPFIEF